jgi:hypothetical protein
MSVFHNNALIGAGGGTAAAAAAVATKSLRFNSGDSAHLSKTFSSAGTQTTWTWSAWVKRSATGQQMLFQGGNTDFNDDSIIFDTSDRLSISIHNGSNALAAKLTSSMVFRDFSAWYHIQVVFDTSNSTADDRIRFYVNGSQLTDIDIRTNPSQNLVSHDINDAAIHYIGTFRGSQHFFNGYLADIYFVDGLALEPTSFGAYDSNNVWQAAAYSGTYGTNGFHLLDFENESTLGHDSSGNDNDFTANNLQSSDGPIYSSGASFSPSQLSSSRGGDKAFDGLTSTNASASTANGSNVTITFSPNLTSVTSLEVYSASNSSFAYINGASGTTVNITANSYTNLSSLASGASGTISSLSVQTNGDNANIAAIKVNGAILVDGDKGDVMFDVPTNGTQSDTGAGGEVSGNYATFNPIASRQTHSNGNLTVVCDGSTLPRAAESTIAVSSGKWYVEVSIDAQTTQKAIIGVVTASYNGLIQAGSAIPNSSLDSVFFFGESGQKIINGGDLESYGSGAAAGDIIGIALNLDDDEITFYKNQNSQGTITNKTFTGAYKIAVGRGSSSGTNTYTLNAGQRPFANSAPSGFKALCTANLPTPTIADGSKYFDTVLYTGTGAAKTISGLNMSPDMAWIKERNDTNWHRIIDAVRGQKEVFPNATNAESSFSQGLNSFNSDGFTLGTGSDSNVNTNNNTYVGWLWDAGSSTVSNTDGSITSSVRANQSAGFSIVSYTGNNGSSGTVGHGLNATPEMFIVKNRDTTGDDWVVYHKTLGATKRLDLNGTGGPSTSSSQFNDTEPTSSVFTVGSFQNINDNYNYIAYCFAPVAGYSAFGSYEGNGSNDGPFVALSFAPAFLMLRRYDSTGDWIIFDNKRNTHEGNYREKVLYPNKSNAEETSANGDTMLFLSNGFKLNNVTFAYWNASDGDYLWAAFAENPFQANGGLAR